MEDIFLGLLVAIYLLIVYTVYKLYFTILLFGLECCSILLWLAFVCLDQNLLDWQITNHLLKAVGLDGFAGDERCLNILAVLCGIV